MRTPIEQKNHMYKQVMRFAADQILSMENDLHDMIPAEENEELAELVIDAERAIETYYDYCKNRML